MYFFSDETTVLVETTVERRSIEPQTTELSMEERPKLLSN